MPVGAGPGRVCVEHSLRAQPRGGEGRGGPAAPGCRLQPPRVSPRGMGEGVAHPVGGGPAAGPPPATRHGVQRKPHLRPVRSGPLAHAGKGVRREPYLRPVRPSPPGPARGGAWAEGLLKRRGPPARPGTGAGAGARERQRKEGRIDPCGGQLDGDSPPPKISADHALAGGGGGGVCGEREECAGVTPSSALPVRCEGAPKNLNCMH